MIFLRLKEIIILYDKILISYNIIYDDKVCFTDDRE